MEWLVHEREADGGEGAERQWGSELILDLPKLGKVRASICVQGGDVRLRFRAGEETASLLQQQSSALADRFAAAGIGLADLVVSHDETE
jgi:flagellar hook-length control protein FliK